MNPVDQVLAYTQQSRYQSRFSREAVLRIPQLNNRYANDAHSVGLVASQETNCWGTTLYTIGARDALTYVDGNEMDDWLYEHTNHASKRAVGDILVQRTWNESLTHTAVYMGKGWYWHETSYNGRWELATYADVIDVYNYAKQLAHYRWIR